MDRFDLSSGEFALPDRPEVSWQASEIVRELDDRPHLLARIQLQGASFPQLDAQPFVRILARRVSVESWFAEVSDDGRLLSGYFPVDRLQDAGVIEYGYGSRVWGRLPGRFEPDQVKRLDQERLPEDAVRVTERFVRRKTAGRVPPDIRLPPRRPRRRRG